MLEDIPYGCGIIFNVSDDKIIPMTERIGMIASKPVRTIGSEESVRAAAKLMSDDRIGSVVVVDEGKPVGIITERDMIDMMSRDVSPIHNHAKDVMSKPLDTVDSEEDPTVGLRKMAEKKIRRLPVVNSGKLVGIVTQRDLMKWLVRDQSALKNMLAKREKELPEDALFDLLVELYLTG